MDPLAVVAILVVAAWVLHIMWQGFKDETKPPRPMADNGHGAKVPICPSCQGVLTTISRKSTGPVGVIGGLIAIIGAALMLFNILAGLLFLAFGLIVYAVGKRSQTVLTCPACGRDAKILN